MFEPNAYSNDLIERASRMITRSAPIHRCPFCRQYGCECPERQIAEDAATDTDEEEDELELSGEQDEVIINPKIENGRVY